MSQKVKNLIADVILFLLSCLFAYLLITTGDLDKFIATVTPIQYLAEFIAGILFTSFITTPFSFAILYALAQEIHPLQIALIGGLGAMIGDMLIITLFKNTIFDDFKTLEKTFKLKRALHFFHTSHFNHLAPLLGLIVIASPFPDELGLMLLGAGKLKTAQLAILVFIINTAGIYAICLISQNI